MRGTRVPSLHVDPGQRFIPAYAGNALKTRRCRCRGTVHPRVCGERLPVVSIAKDDCGSSPRMRGTLRRGQLPFQVIDGSSPRMRGTRACTAHKFRRVRFIPAYAGNASMWIILALLSPVHPRVCGERFSSASNPKQHMRFIPAYAGNAFSTAFLFAGRAVHPRVCGERSPRYAPVARAFGSSPRMRGTPPPTE